FKLYIPDFRAHGKSSWPDPEQELTFLDLLSNDIKEFINRLELHDAFIVGVSLGAGVGIRLAGEGIGKAFVLVGMPNSYDTSLACQVVQGFTEEMMEEWDSSWARAAKNAHSERHGPDHWKKILKLWKKWCCIDGVIPLPHSRCTDIDKPCLIICGDRDPFFPVEFFLALYRALPESSLAILPDCGHLVNEEQPDLFNRMLLDFLLARKQDLYS
ncbi:MAG: alpha/beta hydrolase, partial [Candidatus Eremiobacteraeota bacterium]|nr:alpha/beta hydrolase [Candidatus Eremiobacteraeota bacterium]